MLRRSKGSGQGRARRSSGSQTNKIALALAFLLVPWAQTAAAADTPGVINHRHDPDRSSSPDAAQRHQVHHQNQPRHRGNSAYAIDDEDRDIPHVAWTEPGDDAARDTPYIVHQKNQPPSSRRPQHVADRVPRNDPTDNHPISKNNINIKNRKLNPPNDASALATLAPAQSVRAPNTPRHLRPRNVDGSGLSSPQVARSLEDWEVEDFVLLATVDGDLFASDRRTGAELWRLEVDQPMIETKHYRANSSILDEDYQPIDHYIWAVEPNRDGGLYVMIPDAGAGLMKTSFTMKRLVEELSPFADEDPPVVYTGDKKTTLITLDAATGRVLKWFGSSGSHINQAESCLRPDTLYNMDSTECSSTGTITLGRTEYTVGIQRRDGRPIATLKYAEWGPNNYDKDLYHQYHTSLDNRYITSQHDGKVYAFDYNHAQSPSTPKFRQKFPAPVARVFDVCRPWDAPSDSNPELVVLPQPPMPSHDADIARMRSNSIFLNQTESGSWYAMSGRVYPLIVDAPMAKISRDDWLDFAYQGIGASASKTLIGTHFLEAFSGGASQPATLPAGSVDRGVDDFDNNDSYLHELLPAEPQDVGFLDRVKLLPQSAANSIIDFISNPTLILIFVIFLIYNGNKLRRSYQHFRAKDFFQFLLESKAKADFGTPPKTEVEERVEIEPHDYPTVAAGGPGGVAADVRQGNDNDTAPANTANGIPQPQVSPDSQPLPDTANEAVPAADAQGAPGEKKKKAHRGRRGGVKHRKGKDKDKDKPASQDDANSGPTVDEIIATPGQGIEVLPKDTAPVVPPIPSSVAQAAGGAILTMGNIEVDLKTQLGSGSNGTLVFAGKFDGRDVAVKRMLIHFYDIASQETRLLRESDDHPNVIRYYSQQSKDGFLYIALERCAASLAEVVEKPSSFPTLAEAGKKDLPAVLYQITNGIHHLHSLRIVHRDLKPQNILVNMGKDGKPRLVVSDFGLCKKLEDTQSSFGATTGRAAGTSGWRAPELLVDDGSDGPLQGVLDTDTTNSGSGSVLVNDALGPGVRRATRAIDIFSLGLVFFYVLTNGFHPFDCGDRYMREVNIRNGKFSLAPLDALGNYAFEAKDLIASMLRRNPKDRPHTLEIMSHPFFWSPKKRLAFLCDVSDHFEKECRDPPSPALQELEKNAPNVAGTDFLRSLPREFIDSMGKQRKYTGSRLLDLLRALRNKRNHYEDMSDSLKRQVGPLPEGYLNFWTCRFPMLLLVCWNVVYEVRWEDTDRFREYYSPAGL